MRLLLYFLFVFIFGYFLLFLGELGIFLLVLLMATALFYGVHLLHDLHRHFLPPTTPEDVADQYKKELAEKEANTYKG